MHRSGIVGPGGSWHWTTLDTAFSLAGGVFISAARHYLAALSQLIDQDVMALFGFQCVCRALVESAANAWWLLDASIGARERVARAAVARLYSLDELGHVERSSGREPAEHEARRLKFRADMPQLGLKEKHSGGNRPKLIGYEGISRPDLTRLVSQFLSVLGLRIGEFWYRTMSGVTHSALYGVLQYMDAERVEGQERATLMPRLPIGAVANAAVLGTASHLDSIAHHALLFGRDSAAIGRQRVGTTGEIFKAIGAV
jgi:hypothetical protein